MARAMEHVAPLYPDVQFKDDFDVYLRVSKDYANAAISPPEVTGFATRDVHGVENYENSILRAGQSLIDQVAYGEAYEAFVEDTKNGNRQRLSRNILRLVDLFDPMPEDEPAFMSASERQEANYVFVDSLRRRPKTPEGQQVAEIAVGFTSPDAYAQLTEKLYPLVSPRLMALFGEMQFEEPQF